ncbi:ligand-binding sensor domain-containing protein [Parapedobacter sp. 10938]|uniref:ligand-binding sensor domain-containing protein n=1 Tax=Parapedobacter flavus TaxID=3110225 RepID=UPI002DB72989|nr:triple tyrosine motif-containing protein [Parapedobacter sp. 10938]MEC3878102.1 triple tyrosine motif-containing protein [Parapedobacter sp. 10938]
MNLGTAIKRFLSAVLIFLCATGGVAGQLHELPWVTNYDKSVFQGGTRTWDIGQDSRGYLYFANNDGLMVFNGNFWKKFPLPNGTILRSLAITPQDRVFVGGQGEIGYFQSDTTGSLAYISLTDRIPEANRRFADVWNTVVLGNAVFFRTGNSIFQFEDNRVIAHPAPQEWLFLGRSDNRLLAQDKGSGLLEYRDGQWVPLLGDETMPTGEIAAVFSIGHDSTFIGTTSNRTFLLDGAGIRPLDTGPWIDQYTRSYAKLNDSTYVVGSRMGCTIRQIDGSTRQQFTTHEGLLSNSVTTVFVDRANQIWAGVDNGLTLIAYNSAITFLHPNLNSDLTGYSARIFKGYLYLSTSNGVYRAPVSDPVGGSASHNGFELVVGSDKGDAWRIDEVNGQLLLAHHRGLYAIRGDRVVPLSNGTGSWMFLPMSSAYPIQEVLVGTYDGLDVLRYADGVFHYTHSLEGTPDSYRFLTKDDQNDVWASHPYRGIYRHRLMPGGQRYKTTLFTADHGLPSSYQNYVFMVKNRMVFATKQGVYEFDSALERFVPSKEFSVFRHLALNYLKEDADGNIWFCTGNKIGIARYHSADNRYALTYFPELEGYSAAGFENIYPYNRNNIYIGSEKGFVHLDYEAYLAEQDYPSVVLSEVVVTNDQQDSTLFNGFHASRVDDVHLPASYDTYRFAYSATSYGAGNRIAYSYWLEGYEDKWSPWSDNIEKHYTNLPSGTYRFKVKAIDNLNRESETAVFAFVIDPPWYKTTWALLVYAVVIAVGIYLLLKWQQTVFRNQQQRYEEQLAHLRYVHQLENEKKEKEIVKLQNEKLENEVLSKTKELANTNMQLMENAGTLIKLKDEIAKLNAQSGGKAKDLTRITVLLRDVEKNNKNWSQFAMHFDELNDGFLTSLKAAHPVLSRTDLKLCAYLHLNLSSKEIAQLQNISVRGVEMHRYRLRKKLRLPTERSLNDYLDDI